jgi:phosphonate transport system substrate-binding protein
VIVTNRRRALLATVALAVGAFALVGCPSSEKPSSTEIAGGTPAKLIFGFVPSIEADKIAESAKPMADFLSKELGIPVETFTSTEYTGLIEAMASGKVDIGSLPTLAYVLAKDKNAAQVILKTSRNGSLTYHSMFVARADSGIKKIEDAKGKRMAFVDSASASGYLFPVAYLKKESIDPEKYFAQTMFAGSHDNAVRAVYSGDVDVAAVYDDARNKVEKDAAYKDVKAKVVKIGQTQEIPNDTISVRSGLDPALIEKIRAAFLKFKATPEGKKTLEDVYEVDDLVAASDSDYDPVREVAKSMDVPLENFIPKPKKAAASPSPKP